MPSVRAYIELWMHAASLDSGRVMKVITREII